jgi:DNA-binding response OmpR family regulator
MENGVSSVIGSNLKQILLLEDDLAFGELTASALRQSGDYEIELTRNISDAIDETAHYDLALLDIWIAGKLATEAVQSAAQQNVPLILSSGDALPEAIATIVPNAAFLKKPAKIADLFACVEASLSARQSRTD